MPLPMPELEYQWRAKMSSGNSPSNPIVLPAVTTRDALNAEEAKHLNSAYGVGNWTVTQRIQILDNGVYLEEVIVSLTSGGTGTLYFNITATVYANPNIWDDNDQRPGNG
jgi:hypothetical protein